MVVEEEKIFESRQQSYLRRDRCEFVTRCVENGEKQGEK